MDQESNVKKLKPFSRLSIFQGRGWCCQTGLNCRPLHYQWSALPLSYGSMPGIEGNRPKWPPTRRPVLATRAPLAQARGQAGMGSKSSKMLGLLSMGCFNAVKPQGNPPKISQRQRGSRPSVADIRSARIISSRGFAASWVIAAGGGETHYARVMGAAGGAVPGSIKTCSTE